VHSFMLAVGTSGGAALAGTRGNEGPLAAIALLVLIAFGGLAICLLARRPRPSQEDDDGDSGSGGGGGRRRPTPPPQPGGDPVWWPEFEREFAAYVRSRSQKGSTVTVAVSRVFPTLARP
jgi:hypothetical protein